MQVWVGETGSFSEYIRHPEFERSSAARPQFDFLSDPEKGGLIVDFVGRLEEMGEDFETVCQRIGMTDLKMQQSNRSTKHRLRISEEDSRYLRDRYDVDFEVFGYGCAS
jgi:hypothetical protein